MGSVFGKLKETKPDQQRSCNQAHGLGAPDRHLANDTSPRIRTRSIYVGKSRPFPNEPACPLSRQTSGELANFRLTITAARSSEKYAFINADDWIILHDCHFEPRSVYLCNRAVDTLPEQHMLRCRVAALRVYDETDQVVYAHGAEKA